MKITGELKISFVKQHRYINVDQNHNPKDPRSTRSHEYEHAEIFAEMWNRVVSAVNIYEGKYDCFACASLAIDLANAINRLGEQRADERHNAFHARYNLKIQHPNATVKANALVIEIRDLRNQWHKAGCSFPKKKMR